jgi:hypothetical protein
MSRQNRSHGMSHSLIAPLFGQPVDLEERRTGEAPYRQAHAADPFLEPDACTLAEPRRRHAESAEFVTGSASSASQILPDYLFRINADNTIVDVLRGPSIRQALPCYNVDERARQDVDTGFAETFSDADHHVRGTGAPRRIEQRTFYRRRIPPRD